MMKMILRRFISSNAGLNEVLIVAGARTPIGAFRKSLAPCPAPVLGAEAIRAAVSRAGARPEQVQEVFMGQVCQAGSGQAPSRQATIFAGLHISTPTTTVNKVCASGMKSIMLASAQLASGQQDVMVAGGQESMSQVPFYMRRAEPAYGGARLEDGIVADGLTDVYNQVHMGCCAEKTASELGISREAQDAYAQRSYERARAAAAAGVFAREITPVAVKRGKATVTVSEDEEYGPHVDFGKFARLRPAFQKDGGTVTAANASSLNDGAAAVLLATRSAVTQLGLAPPLARVRGFCDAATQPMDFVVAPVLAVNKLLARAGITAQDVALWEFNEAFSVVGLAAAAQLKLDEACINVHGGAVSMGHPIGASGARITLHLAMALQPGQLGVAAICNGGGGAAAILLEGL